MKQFSIYERYNEYKAKGYNYLMDVDGVRHLIMEMDDLGVTGYVDTMGNINSFGNSQITYDDFAGELLAQGLLNIQLVKDTEDEGRSYYQCDPMFTLAPLEV